MQLVKLRADETIVFKEEMQEAFQHGFQAYYKEDEHNQWQVLPERISISCWRQMMLKHSKPNIGFIHVSFAVGSKEAVDAKTVALHDAGYQVTSGPRITGDGYYESCILGPEGVQIEITI